MEVKYKERDVLTGFNDIDVLEVKSNVESFSFTRNGNVLSFNSLKKIKEISLFDQSGRVMKMGNRINDYSFNLNINVGFYKFMALVVKVAFEDSYFFKRVDLK